VQPRIPCSSEYYSKKFKSNKLIQSCIQKSGKDHLRYVDAHMSIVWRYFVKKSVNLQTIFNSLKAGSSSGHFVNRVNFWFHRKQFISWLAEWFQFLKKDCASQSYLVNFWFHRKQCISWLAEWFQFLKKDCASQGYLVNFWFHRKQCISWLAEWFQFLKKDCASQSYT
jgi:hypothetical protein